MTTTKKKKAERKAKKSAKPETPVVPVSEIDADAFAKKTAENEAATEAATNATAAAMLGDAILDATAGAVIEEPARIVEEPPIVLAPSAEGAPAPRKGGWQKGRPRGPRSTAATGTPAAHTPVSGAVLGDPVRAARGLERENAQLKTENANLKARTDENTHKFIRKGIGALIVIAGNMSARKFGDHMRVPVQEADEAGEHVGNALIPFLGDYSKYMPIVVAAGALASVMIPRAQYEQEIREGKHQRIRDGQPYVLVEK